MSLQAAIMASQSTYIALLLDDVPKVLNSITVRGKMGAHTMSFSHFYAHSRQCPRGILGGMRWCIDMHECYFATEGTVLLFAPRKRPTSSLPMIPVLHYSIEILFLPHFACNV